MQSEYGVQVLVNIMWEIGLNRSRVLGRLQLVREKPNKKKRRTK